MQDRLIEEQQVEDFREEVYAYEKVEEREHREKQKRLERKLKRYERIEKSKPQKHILTLKIPIKSSKELNKGNLKILQIKTLQKPLVRLVQYSALKCQLATKVFPRLNTLRVAVEDIRIPTLKPMNIRTLATPHLKLGLGSIPDISIRPLIYQKLNKLTKTINPLFKHIRVVAYIPLTITTHIERVNTVYIPRIRLSTKEAIPDITRHTLTKEKDIAESIAGSESKECRHPEKIDFIEAILGKGSGKILSGKPLCVIVEKHKDKYEYVVATICREIYREKRGLTPPKPVPVKTVDEIEFKIKADVSDQIIIVENARYSENLRKTLLKLPFSGLGFLILVTDKPEELEMEIRRNVPTAEEFLLKIEPTKINEDLKVKIIEFIRGSRLLKSYSFGEDFMKAVDEFEKTLFEYLDYNKAPNELKIMWHKLMAKSPESTEQASEVHSAMKSLVWQYLWRKYGRIPKLEDERGVDISINNENYEIETFYKCGNPIAKLTEKMEKFSQNDKVFFVLRNISALIHLKELISFKKTWKDLGYSVEILGIDFERRELVTIDEILSHFIPSKLDSRKICSSDRD